jgi:hypothetical protein
MKNLILIALLLITVCCKAQTTKPIDGFLGIKFGSSPAQVIEALKAKGGIVNTGQTPFSISFSNVSLGSRKTAAVFVHFVNEQAFGATFVFKPELEAKTIEYYNALVKDISEVYGQGKELKKFKQPYTEGDGYEITAIKTGNADYYTAWDEENGNEVLVVIAVTSTNELRVRLIYNHGKLRKLYEDQQKAKNKSEF